MARSLMYDPGTIEARSPWLAGLTDICNKLSGILNLETGTFEDLTLPELYISEEDRFRIYQAPLGNKMWLQSPTPVIKKNGITIDPDFDGFEIDYLGGSIVFSEEYILKENDIVTASATYLIDKSKTIDTLISRINDLATKTGSFQGSFASLEELKTAVPEGTAGYYAVVQNGNTIYIWSESKSDWTDVYKETDLSDYLTSEQVDALLALKENNISPVADTLNAESYYYSGNKTWVKIFDIILGTVLDGLDVSTPATITDTDSLLIAIGKLQAQINSNIHAIFGNSEPSVDLVGKVGQDYVDISSGKKYHLVRIENASTSPKYIWEQYISSSELNTVKSDLTQSITNVETNVKDYVDSSIQTAVLNSWAGSY